jgi:hypothetical protein
MPWRLARSSVKKRVWVGLAAAVAGPAGVQELALGRGALLVLDLQVLAQGRRVGERQVRQRDERLLARGGFDNRIFLIECQPSDGKSTVIYRYECFENCDARVPTAHEYGGSESTIYQVISSVRLSHLPVVY